MQVDFHVQMPFGIHRVLLLIKVPREQCSRNCMVKINILFDIGRISFARTTEKSGQ